MTMASERALAIFPAGVSNGEFGLPDEHVVVMSRGGGCRLWDSDGKEYLDFSMGWGSVLVGHARPEVVAAVRAQAGDGSNFAYLNSEALGLAEEIARISPAAERLRFCASGTEATMYCQRLARAFTGRPQILKFEGAYHGANEAGVTSLFPNRLPDFPEPELTSAGTPDAKHSLLVAPFNDLEKTQALLAEYAASLAGVIVEPLQRCTPPVAGFLEGLRAACSEHDVLLIYDEVVTGFRLAPGGGQGYFEVTPDLATYGKVVGGSGPLSCVAGRAEIVDLADPARKGEPDFVYFNGTLHGNPVAAAATLATLDELARPQTHDRLNAYADDFCREAQKVLAANRVGAIACNTGSLWQILFMAAPPRNQADMLAGDGEAMRRLDTELLKRGQYNIPGVRRFFSLAHGEREMEETLKALDESCRALA